MSHSILILLAFKQISLENDHLHKFLLKKSKKLWTFERKLGLLKYHCFFLEESKRAPESRLILGLFSICHLWWSSPFCFPRRRCHGKMTKRIHKCRNNKMLNAKPAKIRAIDSMLRGWSRKANHQMIQHTTESTVNWSMHRWQRPIFFQNQCSWQLRQAMMFTSIQLAQD